ncbi:MAG: hypothetical protein LUH41_01570 [Clostridiales bacterium]|nr:hypothetical protein [Clostridiales bacterium]MCD7880816.1 hypothetical protein [Clostridiales bacterium]
MSCSKFLSGVGIGVAVGAAIAMSVSPKPRCIKRSPAGKAIRAVTEVMDHVADAMGL